MSASRCQERGLKPRLPAQRRQSALRCCTPSQRVSLTQRGCVRAGRGCREQEGTAEAKRCSLQPGKERQTCPRLYAVGVPRQGSKAAGKRCGRACEDCAAPLLLLLLPCLEQAKARHRDVRLDLLLQYGQARLLAVPGRHPRIALRPPPLHSRLPARVWWQARTLTRPRCVLISASRRGWVARRASGREGAASVPDEKLASTRAGRGRKEEGAAAPRGRASVVAPKLASARCTTAAAAAAVDERQLETGPASPRRRPPSG